MEYEFRTELIKSNGASSSMFHDRMFPDAYHKNRDELVLLLGPKVPLGVIATDARHPLHDIIDALLVMITCQELSDGYSGVGWGSGGGGSSKSTFMMELAGFIRGFYFSATGDVPARYTALVDVVKTIRAMPKDPKKDPEYKDWVRLNKKFGHGPQE